MFCVINVRFSSEAQAAREFGTKRSKVRRRRLSSQNAIAVAGISEMGDADLYAPDLCTA
jgi:hypothetical protein